MSNISISDILALMVSFNILAINQYHCKNAWVRLAKEFKIRLFSVFVLYDWADKRFE